MHGFQSHYWHGKMLPLLPLLLLWLTRWHLKAAPDYCTATVHTVRMLEVVTQERSLKGGFTRNKFVIKFKLMAIGGMTFSLPPATTTTTTRAPRLISSPEISSPLRPNREIAICGEGFIIPLCSS